MTCFSPRISACQASTMLDETHTYDISTISSRGNHNLAKKNGPKKPAKKNDQKRNIKRPKKNGRKKMAGQNPAQKTAKMAKKGQKIAVFWPSRAEICENQKKAWTFSYFYPREAVYQISENLAHQTWRKCVTNELTNGRTGLKS